MQHVLIYSVQSGRRSAKMAVGIYLRLQHTSSTFKSTHIETADFWAAPFRG